MVGLGFELRESSSEPRELPPTKWFTFQSLLSCACSPPVGPSWCLWRETFDPFCRVEFCFRVRIDLLGASSCSLAVRSSQMLLCGDPGTLPSLSPLPPCPSLYVVCASACVCLDALGAKAGCWGAVLNCSTSVYVCTHVCMCVCV